MNSQQYMAELRSRYRISSAYAVAKLLRVSQNSVARYDKGLGTFDDDIACRVAELLDLHPGVVILDMHKERSQSDRSRRVWEEIQEGFCVPLLHARSGRRLALPR